MTDQPVDRGWKGDPGWSAADHYAAADRCLDECGNIAQGAPIGTTEVMMRRAQWHIMKAQIKQAGALPPAITSRLPDA